MQKLNSNTFNLCFKYIVLIVFLKWKCFQMTDFCNYSVLFLISLLRSLDKDLFPVIALYVHFLRLPHWTLGIVTNKSENFLKLLVYCLRISIKIVFPHCTIIMSQGQMVGEKKIKRKEGVESWKTINYKKSFLSSFACKWQKKFCLTYLFIGFVNLCLSLC